MVDAPMPLLLAGLPRLLHFGPNTTTFLTLAAVAVALATFTIKWEVSLIKLLPTKVHLMADLGLGALCLVAPFLFLKDAGTVGTYFLVAFGLIEIGAGLLTKTHSSLETVQA